MTTRRTLALALAVLGLAAACQKIDVPGDQRQIVAISEVDVALAGGAIWHVTYYENRAYPCSLSGYQTFVLGTRADADPAATAPLWVKMHGGGVGYFRADGKPTSPGMMDQESRSALIGTLDAGLALRVAEEPEPFRLLAVSMCSHDIYAGTNTPDPGNPDPNRPTNGLYATNAAIRYAMGQFPTDDLFLHGGSAGSAGTWHVAWSLQRQGLAPAGVVADSGVLNAQFEQAKDDQGSLCARGAEAADRIPDRLDAQVVDPANQPDLLVASGRLTVPFMHVWSSGDQNQCGATPIVCPTATGDETMGTADCMHERVATAIDGRGPTSRSENLRLCVDDPRAPEPCDKHVSTNIAGTSSVGPADYNGYILDWVHARQADDAD